MASVGMQGLEECLGEFKSRVVSLCQWSYLNPIAQTFNLLTIRAGQGGPGPSVEGTAGMCVSKRRGPTQSYQSWRDGRKLVFLRAP